jgi:predicted enzyme related to lactoylglutathione lyase
MPDAAGTGTIVYFDTDNIDQSIKDVRAGGGTADAKTPIPHIGWFTRCKDTEGNAFSLFQGDESATA